MTKGKSKETPKSVPELSSRIALNETHQVELSKSQAHQVD